VCDDNLWAFPLSIAPKENLLKWQNVSPTTIFVTRRYIQHYEFFYIFFLSRFCKHIYGPPEIHLPPWPTAVGAASSGPLVWDRHSVVTHGVRSITSWATALCSSAMGHGGSRPASAVGHGARIWLPI
jgi:hypothetical protein